MSPARPPEVPPSNGSPPVEPPPITPPSDASPPAGPPSGKGVEKISIHELPTQEDRGRQTDGARLLPPHKGKLSRIQDYVEGTVVGIREWMELRLELAKAEVREKISEAQEKIKFGVLMGVLGALAGFFLLLTIGFGFSALFRALFDFGQLASLTAGYGLLTLLLAGAAGIMYLRSPFKK